MDGFRTTNALVHCTIALLAFSTVVMGTKDNCLFVLVFTEVKEQLMWLINVLNLSDALSMIEFVTLGAR